MVNLGSYLAVAGDVEDAIAAACEAIRLVRGNQAETYVAIAAQVLALCAARVDPHRAARLLGYVDATYERRGAKHEPTEGIVREALVKRLEERLEASILQAEIARGRELDPEAASELALAGAGFDHPNESA